jgi:hypothetical protein
MAIFYDFTDISKGNNKICVVREASHIDFVNEKHHMDVSLETPPPPPPPGSSMMSHIVIDMLFL